jgi:RNA polymerase sigma-70 factor (ECF subfamily)
MNAPVAPHAFHPTRWTLVRQAAGAGTTVNAEAVAAHALSTLCEAYWYPVYAFLRRSGKGPHDAEDLTQGFFAQLLRKKTFAAADPGKGKLRSFLLTCVRRYLADEHDRAMAQKRGASVLVSFSPDWAEQTYATEPVDELTPDRLFQRRWALTVLDHSLEVLGDEYTAAGKGDTFATLRPFLGFAPDPEKRYEDIAAQTGTPVATLKTNVWRNATRSPRAWAVRRCCTSARTSPSKTATTSPGRSLPWSGTSAPSAMKTRAMRRSSWPATPSWNGTPAPLSSAAR